MTTRGFRLLTGFPVIFVTSAGSRPGGRPSSLLYDKEEGKKAYPAVAPPSGVPSFRQCRAGSSQTRPAGSNMRSPSSARHTLQSARQRGQEMQVTNGRHPTRFPQRLGASEKPVPTPPSSAPAGGEVGRRPTGGGGSPSLPPYMDASRVTSKFLSFGSADSLRSYIRPVGAVRTLVRCGP